MNMRYNNIIHDTDTINWLCHRFRHRRSPFPMDHSDGYWMIELFLIHGNHSSLALSAPGRQTLVCKHRECPKLVRYQSHVATGGNRGSGPPTSIQTPLEISANSLKSFFTYLGGGIPHVYISSSVFLMLWQGLCVDSPVGDKHNRGR